MSPPLLLEARRDKIRLTRMLPSLTLQVGEEELFLGKTWKLNAERNNGRAAMMGITGMLIHEALTGNPVFPIGETL